MYNFIKQNYIEVERGLEYMNYQREVAILTDFWQKYEEKDPKKKKLKEKKPKIKKKIKKHATIFHLKRIFSLCKALWHQFPRLAFRYSIE